MNELPTTDVAGWVHDQLQGEVIEQGGPELPPDTTPVIIDGPVATRFEPSSLALFSISPNHRRSYEYGNGHNARRIGELAIWHDQYDNPYTSFSLKGNNFSRHEVTASMTAPSGYMAYGLLESDALLRVVRASHVLREGHVSTEWINRVFEPKELIYEGKKVSQAEYKRLLLGKVALTRGLKESARIAEAIEPMTFFITARSMEINDRPADFIHDTNASLDDRLHHIFRVYNTLHRADLNFRVLDAEKPGDVREYLSEIMPFLIGRSLGRLHNLGLVHSFPVMGNVTTLGGLIDLDSIKGAPLELGEPAITPEDKALDIYQLMDVDPGSNQFVEVYRHLIELGASDMDGYVRALDMIVESYQAHRTPEPDKQGQEREKLYLSLTSFRSRTELLQVLEAVMGDEAVRELERVSYQQSWKFMLARLKTGEYADYEVTRQLDRVLRTFARKKLANEAIATDEITAKLTSAAQKVSLRDVLYKSDTEIGAAIEELQTNANLAAHFDSALPDTRMRQYILRGLVELMGRVVETTLDMQAPQVHQTLVTQIQELAHLRLNMVIEGLSDSFWQPVVDEIPAFADLKLVSSPDRMTVYESKSVFAYSGQELSDVLSACRAADIPVEIEPLPMQGRDNFFLKEAVYPRALLSDAPYVNLQYLFDEDNESVLNPTGFDRDRTEYIAWLLEDEHGARRLSLIHRDPEAVL